MGIGVRRTSGAGGDPKSKRWGWREEEGLGWRGKPDFGEHQGEHGSVAVQGEPPGIRGVTDKKGRSLLLLGGGAPELQAKPRPLPWAEGAGGAQSSCHGDSQSQLR